MTGFLARFVAKFGRERPDLRIHIDSLPSDIPRDQVLNGILDLGVTLAPFATA